MSRQEWSDYEGERKPSRWKDRLIGVGCIVGFYGQVAWVIWGMWG